MSLEVKIECACGQHYAFDVEPVNGQMPSPVQCPTCGADGTAAANQNLSQVLGAQSVPTVRPVSPRLRVTGAAAPAAAETVAEAAVPVAPALVGPAGGPKKVKRGYGEPNMVAGSAGAVVGGLVGLVIWYAMVRYAHIQSGIVAWMVGGIVGFGCRVLGGGYSHNLGLIAGLCALVAIVGGKYVAVQSMFDEAVAEEIGRMYKGMVAEAKKAVQLETEADMRAFLAEGRSARGGVKVTTNQITDADLAEFQQKGLPFLRDLATGKTTEAKFKAWARSEMVTLELRGNLLKESLNLWTVLFLFLGVGTAYRLGVGEDTLG